MTDYKQKIEALWAHACSHYEQCKQHVRYKKGDKILCKFRFDRARVGADYGKDAAIPKIVMVGIEGFADEQTVSCVTAPSLTADNPHYNGVKYTLAYLLADFLQQEKPAPIITGSGVDWIKDALSRYCLCNLFRCAFVPEHDANRTKKLCHTDEMKTHCFEWLLKEIGELDPDVVVVQATASGVLPDNDPETIPSAFGCRHNPYGNSKRARLYQGQLNGHALLVVQTLHGAYGGFKSHAYLQTELNPVLDETIRLLKATRM